MQQQIGNNVVASWQQDNNELEATFNSHLKRMQCITTSYENIMKKTKSFHEKS
jgi:hypothetical protein